MPAAIVDDSPSLGTVAVSATIGRRRRPSAASHARNRRVTSQPSMSGMWQSIKTAS
jgi:hypothetical protein